MQNWKNQQNKETLPAIILKKQNKKWIEYTCNQMRHVWKMQIVINHHKLDQRCQQNESDLLFIFGDECWWLDQRFYKFEILCFCYSNTNEQGKIRTKSLTYLKESIKRNVRRNFLKSIISFVCYTLLKTITKKKWNQILFLLIDDLQIVISCTYVI